MKKIILSIDILLASVNIFAQDIYHLTLEESIEIAKEKNYSMKQLAQDTKIAEYNLKATTSRLKTNIRLNLDLPNYEKTIKDREDSTGVYFYSVEQLAYAGNLRVNQPLPTDGNIYLQTNMSTIKDYYNKIRTSRLNTRIGFEQPLDIFYGYSSIRTSLKNAQLENERSNRVYKRQELQMIYNVTQSYYNLLSNQKQTEIALLNLDRQKEAYEISKNKYEAGLIREVDALQMEVDLAEAQNGYDMAVFNQYSSINSFKELIGINLTDSVTLNSQLIYKKVIVNPEEAVQYALKNRSEIREREIQIEMSKLSVKQQKTQGLPRGSINAYYEQTGYDPTNSDISIANSIENSYQNYKDRGPGFGIGFTVSIPILDFGQNRALVKAAEARLKNTEYQKEMEMREIERSVRNLATSIGSNLQRLQLLEKNVSVAEKSFEITLRRYSDGDIDSQSLALERNRLNNAHTSYLSAYIQYQLSLAQLRQATLYDFQNDVAL